MGRTDPPTRVGWKEMGKDVALSVLVLAGILILGAALGGDGGTTDGVGAGPGSTDYGNGGASEGDKADSSGSKEVTAYEGAVTLTEWTNDYHEHLDGAMWTTWEGEIYDSAVWEMEPKESDGFVGKGMDYRCQKDYNLKITVGVRTKDERHGSGDNLYLVCEGQNPHIEVYINSLGRVTVSEAP